MVLSEAHESVDSKCSQPLQVFICGESSDDDLPREKNCASGGRVS
eukprot:CAMPEP_0175904460 /NCGR_PEP_ID=MMETSP0108-20121206/4486_1 /TAXON_ID=195067 ORGANISM="Goniomonas pacifica, Strain CCMP1869" /NCGR_SAMPLE_ID=MMETSP0108 /ASSEMBLY_ACC=CAM_ASM_000204 /LENGTH=44 /DNA_ID= /DNA_START= /DNA_END= /DNA_ORIENTATION=